MSDICQSNINKWYDQISPTAGHTVLTLDKKVLSKLNKKYSIALKETRGKLFQVILMKHDKLF